MGNMIDVVFCLQARDTFKITKTSKKGNTRKVDLQPQLLDLSHMDQREVDAALEGRRVPVPKTPPAGTGEFILIFSATCAIRLTSCFFNSNLTVQG